MTATEAELSATFTIAAVVLADDELAGSAITALLSGAGVTIGDVNEPPPGAVAVVVDPSERTWEQVDSVGLRAVVLTDGEPDDGVVIAAALRGACGFVDVRCSSSELLAVMESVARHGAALSPNHGRAVLDALRHRGRAILKVTLTSREQQILEAIAAGESVKQTARRLGVSPRTIDNTQRVMFLKLSVRNRAHAVARAHELGLLESDGR